MMRSLAMFLLTTVLMMAQTSPHGPLQWKCTDCHTTDGWTTMAQPMSFDHGQTTFRLYGQHRNTACKQCHTDNRFKGTAAVCVVCHKKDFDHTVSPNHRLANFTPDCSLCHTQDALSWHTAFDHNRTNFPTRGIHEAVECRSCHVNGIFRGTPKDCYSCHAKQYAATTSPNHAAAKFPTDCATCHRALTWQPAAFFPHDQYFGITSSDTHRPGRWKGCADCHPAAPVYTTFECIYCHEHSKSSTDRHHSDVKGYLYQSSSCYRCHRNV